jgi:hypothetical protein
MDRNDGLPSPSLCVILHRSVAIEENVSLQDIPFRIAALPDCGWSGGTGKKKEGGF